MEKIQPEQAGPRPCSQELSPRSDVAVGSIPA